MQQQQRRVAVVKVGGSVLSIKGDAERVLEPLGLETVRQVVAACEASGVHPVLVTGAGSFGHVLARRYGLSTRPAEQAKTLSRQRALQALEVHRSVQDLARYRTCLAFAALDRRIWCSIVEAHLCQAGHAAVALSHPHWQTEQQPFQDHVLAEINHLHERGVIPIFFGDMQFAATDPFVLSGDVIAPFIANLYGCGLVMVSSHCLHAANPSAAHTAPMVHVLDPIARRCLVAGCADWRPLDELAVGAALHDVSGGMLEKVRCAMRFCEQPHRPRVAIVAAKDVSASMDTVLQLLSSSAAWRAAADDTTNFTLVGVVAHVQ